MIRSLSRVLLLAAALLAVHSGTTRSATAAACPYSVRCPNGSMLICQTSNCRPIDNCSQFCNGRVQVCGGPCTHE